MSPVERPGVDISVLLLRLLLGEGCDVSAAAAEDLSGDRAEDGSP